MHGSLRILMRSGGWISAAQAIRPANLRLQRNGFRREALRRTAKDRWRIRSDQRFQLRRQQCIPRDSVMEKLVAPESPSAAEATLPVTEIGPTDLLPRLKDN